MILDLTFEFLEIVALCIGYTFIFFYVAICFLGVFIYIGSFFLWIKEETCDKLFKS